MMSLISLKVVAVKFSFLSSIGACTNVLRFSSKSSNLLFEKILFKYFHLLKVNCNFVIDDTSWLPYTKNREKNHFFMEVNNYETFFRLIKIYNSNFEKMNLEFSIGKLIRSFII